MSEKRFQAMEEKLAFFEMATADMGEEIFRQQKEICLLYTSPSPRDVEESRMPSSA